MSTDNRIHLTIVFSSKYKVSTAALQKEFLPQPLHVQCHMSIISYFCGRIQSEIPSICPLWTGIGGIAPVGGLHLLLHLQLRPAAAMVRMTSAATVNTLPRLFSSSADLPPGGEGNPQQKSKCAQFFPCQRMHPVPSPPKMPMQRLMGENRPTKISPFSRQRQESPRTNPKYFRLYKYTHKVYN